MKYTKRTLVNDIINDYDNVIAWGTGTLFKTNYRKDYFPLDFIVDGTNAQECEYAGIPVKGESSLEHLQGKSLIIIYTIYEAQIIKQVEKYNTNNQIDIIIYSLLDVKLNNGVYVSKANGKNCEDVLTLMLARQLGLQSVSFLEIGVCHPIMRNNTYLLYEQFSNLPGYEGVLVEANPICWDIISEYRNKDRLIKKGVTRTKGKMPFWAFPDLLGYSTFDEELAKATMDRGYACERMEVETDTINSIIEKSFNRVPDILALDAEGFDYDILFDWDFKQYPFKIVVAEAVNTKEEPIETLMDARGYRRYARTVENVIWVKG